LTTKAIILCQSTSTHSTTPYFEPTCQKTRAMKQPTASVTSCLLIYTTRSMSHRLVDMLCVSAAGGQTVRSVVTLCLGVVTVVWSVCLLCEVKVMVGGLSVCVCCRNDSHQSSYEQHQQPAVTRLCVSSLTYLLQTDRQTTHVDHTQTTMHQCQSHTLYKEGTVLICPNLLKC